MKVKKIEFEVLKDQVYNEEFFKKIRQGDKDFEDGKGRKVTMNELNDLLK